MYLFLFWRLYSRSTLCKYTPKYSSPLASIIVPVLQYAMLTNQFWKGGLFKGKRTPCSSLLPFQSRWCKTGSSSFALPLEKRKRTSWGLSDGTAPLAEQGQARALCKLLPSSCVSSPRPVQSDGGWVLSQLQLSSNEIPRVAVKSLLLLVH